jgi:hypothetical protein
MRKLRIYSDLIELKIKLHYFNMKTILLPSGTYAVDDLLADFDIIEKPSSNVAFVATNIATRQLYVQFKNGSGYMYSDVDLDLLSFIPAAESIGKFISSHVVKKFPSVKLDKQLIIFDATKMIQTALPDHIVTMDDKGTINIQEPEF